MQILKQDGQGIQKLYNRNMFARKKHIEEKSYDESLIKIRRM